MQKISHVTLKLFHSRAAKGQKERSCSVTITCAAASAYHCKCNVLLAKIQNLLSMRSSRPALILPLLLSITPVTFIVLTICGHGQAPFPASTTSRPHFLRANRKVAQHNPSEKDIVFGFTKCICGKAFPRNGAMQEILYLPLSLSRNLI